MNNAGVPQASWPAEAADLPRPAAQTRGVAIGVRKGAAPQKMPRADGSKQLLEMERLRRPGGLRRDTRRPFG